MGLLLTILLILLYAGLIWLIAQLIIWILAQLGILVPVRVVQLLIGIFVLIEIIYAVSGHSLMFWH